MCYAYIPCIHDIHSEFGYKMIVYFKTHQLVFMYEVGYILKISSPL